MRGQARLAISVAAALLGLAALPAAAQAKATPESYKQRFAALCAACHGANGRSDMPGTPALAGQHSFYAITQLFLFREGRRGNEAMTAVAKTMSDQDLRGFSEYIGTLPPVPAPPPATPPDAARMARGQALAQEHRCVMCHGSDLSGGQQVARIGQQREDYLQMTLREFKSGKRPGYTQAMGEAVSQIPPEDLDTIAYYVARFPGAPAKPAGK
ncbi:c-type cytochrome [Variovorax sp. J2P1-59]|uniref:c-type cytochrome n=1 Tax=Variovorax flavidus TaxID=3053501 RepID=UPI002575E1AF|nr:c-type cytochrome [Variovorax sp. J2P1-59]MDM0074673.1 c-type cytochrome [Variovorax sp. J2P1-59]